MPSNGPSDGRNANGTFAPGNKAAVGRASTTTLANHIRAQTNNGLDLINILLKMVKGEIAGTKPRDRNDAMRMLFERAFGKAPEIVLTGELETEATQAVNDLSKDEITELIRSLKPEPAPAPTQATVKDPN